MRRVFVLMFALGVLLAAGVTPVLAGGNSRNAVAKLSGGAEVPQVVTDGHGVGTVNAQRGTFKLNVVDLTDVVAAHIHCAPAGANGPVGVTLFSGGPATKNGRIASGTILPDPGNACGWADVADVLGAIGAGNAYINVHTLSVPSGEIRGQLS